MKRGETVAIWKGTRTQSVWEYTIGCAATRIQTARVAVVFLYYDLGPAGIHPQKSLIFAGAEKATG